MNDKITPGDIYAIDTQDGYGLFQYVVNVPKFGALIKVFEKKIRDAGVSSITSEVLSRVVDSGILCQICFPLQYAVKNDVVRRVGSMKSGNDVGKLPVFRQPGSRDKNGNVSQWFYWESGETNKIVPETPENLQLPILSVWNDTALVDFLNGKWKLSYRGYEKL